MQYIKPFRTGSLHAACTPKLRNRKLLISASATSSSSGRTESSNLATVYSGELLLLARLASNSGSDPLLPPQLAAQLLLVKVFLNTWYATCTARHLVGGLLE